MTSSPEAERSAQPWRLHNLGAFTALSVFYSFFFLLNVLCSVTVSVYYQPVNYNEVFYKETPGCNIIILNIRTETHLLKYR